MHCIARTLPGQPAPSVVAVLGMKVASSGPERVGWSARLTVLLAAGRVGLDGGVPSETLPDSPRESLSQFTARVLDQMRLSAWLPALAAVAGVLGLGQLAANAGSVADALADIGAFGFAEIVLLVLAVVVVTMFSQAFEFAAVRVLIIAYVGSNLL